MFEQLPNNQGSRGPIDHSGVLKAIVVSAVGLLLGIGLCGVGAITNRTAEFGGGISMLGAAVVVIAALFLFCSFAVLLISLLINQFRR